MQQKNSSSSSSSSFDSYMLQGSNAFKWLSISSKCGLEDYIPACIKLIASNQLPVPAEGITSLVQPHHADALILGLQKGQLEALQLFKAKQQECQAALSEAAVLRIKAARVSELELSVEMKRGEIQSLMEAQAEMTTQMDEATARMAEDAARITAAAEPTDQLLCPRCRNAAHLLPGGETLAPYCLFCGLFLPHRLISCHD